MSGLIPLRGKVCEQTWGAVNAIGLNVFAESWYRSDPFCNCRCASVIIL
jgi:hypothetical protein